MESGFVLAVVTILCFMNPLREMIDAFPPLALTAAAVAVIVGAGVILFDPIFQGLAISLVAGEVASLLLLRMPVPALYYVTKRHERMEQITGAAPMEVPS